MEPHDLECVTALSRAGHLRHAAHALGISQASLLARVAALGSELFIRSARGVHATAAGAAFLAYAHRALEEIAADDADRGGAP